MHFTEDRGACYTGTVAEMVRAYRKYGRGGYAVPRRRSPHDFI